MKGECLCGEVAFTIDGELPNLYQCHCSLCRKATGAAANAATFVQGEQFKWLSGQGSIRSYQRDSGYRSDFCATCGSPVPNQLRGSDWVWVPAGLLEDETTARVAVHLHMALAAAWEQEATHCQRFDASPESLEALYSALRQV